MAKGRNFEREIAAKISLWLTNGKTDECVWHTEGSGARATSRSKRKKVKDTMFGDLCTNDPSLQNFFNLINIELKSGYFVSKTKRKKGGTTITNWSFNDMIDSTQEKNIFWDFWDQCTTDADKSNREPILIFRRNRRKACIAMRSDLFNAFKVWGNYVIPEYCIEIKFTIVANTESITVCNLDEFIEYFPYDDSILKGPITKTMMKRRK
jgi:hypothetical protein